jgi:hypothetical protein
MNKLKLLAAVALAGLLGSSARASLPTSYSSVNIKLTVLVQTNDTTTSSVDKFNVLKIKVINKDVLQRVANEFTNVFTTAAVVPAGAQLVISGGFVGGHFAVLGRTNNVLLANASSGSGSYALRISNPGYDIFAGQSVSGGTTVFNVTTIGEFFWSDRTDANYVEIIGQAKVKDTYPHTGNSPESFSISGASNGYLSGRDANVSGSVSGSGKDTANFGP